VFGLLKRCGKAYAKVIPNLKGSTLKAILDLKVVPDSIVYSDALSSYNVLDVSSFKHYRINPLQVVLRSENHINGIENL
jgi:transposase